MDGRTWTARGWWAELQRLQALHAARHDLSGREALAARRQLRWDGATLRGEVLPAPDSR